MYVSIEQMKKCIVWGSQVSHWGRRNIQVTWNGRNCGDRLELEVFIWTHFWNMYMQKYSHVTHMHICVFVCIYACTCTYLTLSTKGPRTQDTPGTVSTLVPRSWSLISFPTRRNRTRADRCNEPAKSCYCYQVRKCSKNGGLSQGHTCQLEGTPTGPTWPSWTLK